MSFTTQNKLRPGVYTKFKGIPSKSNILGKRGIVVACLPLGFGPVDDFIKITVEDINNLEKRFGFDILDQRALTIRKILENAHTLYVYRSDGDSTIGSSGAYNKASSALIAVREESTGTQLLAVAKYPGTGGNLVSVKVETSGDKYAVITYMKNNEVDRQLVTNTSELVPNDYVVWQLSSLSGSHFDIEKTCVNTLLTNGSDGLITASQYTTYISKLDTLNFDIVLYTVPTLIITSFEELDAQMTAVETFISEFNTSTIVEKVKALREKGKKCQLVIHNYQNANHEGIINISDSIILFNDDYIINSIPSSALGLYLQYFLAPTIGYIAGLNAGATATESLTYRTLTNIKDVISTFNYQDAVIEELIRTGYMIISKRRDGNYIIEKDINSLVTLREDTNEAFKENKTIRLLDIIANDIVLEFENNYIGKINNNETGKNLFKTYIISYLNNLQASGAIINFNSVTDITVESGEQPDALYCELFIQPTYAVDKLYMIVNIR